MFIIDIIGNFKQFFLWIQGNGDMVICHCGGSRVNCRSPAFKYYKWKSWRLAASAERRPKAENAAWGWLLPRNLLFSPLTLAL